MTLLGYLKTLINSLLYNLLNDDSLDTIMQKFFCLVLCIGSLLSYSTITYCAELTGQIVSDDALPLASVKFTVNGQVTETDLNGRFTVKAEDSKIYQLQIDQEGYYQSIQTFSHAELSRQLPKPFDIAPIGLVARKPGRTLFAFGGDVMLGRRFSQPKFGDPVLVHNDTKLEDAKSLLSAMKPYLALADLASVNLETQLGDEQLKKGAQKAITFYSPPEILAALSWAGVDYVSLGNNHTYDFLDKGLVTTLTALETSQLGYSGAGTNEEQALKPYIANVNQNNYALSAYVGWAGSANPNQVAASNKGGAALGTDENIKRVTQKVIKSNQIPIVQYHGSLEYTDQPTLTTEQRLKYAIDAGASLAVTHHPHVIQGFEIYKGKLIAYSLGNFLFDQDFYATSNSMLLYVWMDGETFHRAEIVPVYIKGYQPTPAMGLSRFQILKRLTELSSLRKTRIGSSGGHGIIDPVRQSLAESSNFSVDIAVKNQSIKALDNLPWHRALQSIGVDSNTQYRLGNALSNGGDFETHNLFQSAERGWQITGAVHSIVEMNANNAVKLELQGTPATFAMKAFTRIYQPGALNSFTLDIRAPKGTTVKLYWQGSKAGQRVEDALANNEKHLLKIKQLESSGWSTISADFMAPRVDHVGIRVIAEISGSGNAVLLDNCHLVEWNTAYTEAELPPYQDIRAKQASFIGFPAAYSGQLKISLRD